MTLTMCMIVIVAWEPRVSTWGVQSTCAPDILTISAQRAMSAWCTFAKAAGLESAEHEDNEIQDALQSEARQQISLLERGMNYLGITASIAPMLGFLGTIFGVIKIFYNISVTNDLNIANISDGLYQKMICSGAGLFVGIIAYSGYYILNGRIDRIVVNIDKYSNNLLKDIRNQKRAAKA